MGWQYLDAQLAQFYDRLITEVKISKEIAKNLASTIEIEVQALSFDEKNKIRDASPIPCTNRIDELKAFQGWMSRAFSMSDDPYVVRAQLIYQNCICFVYLREACFYALSKYCAAGTATKKCAKFLVSNPIRAFRNAVAHANWMYRDDFRAITYWARKGDSTEEKMDKFEVAQNDLRFWQALSRCVAYVTFSTINCGIL